MTESSSGHLPRELLAPRYWIAWLGIALFWIVSLLPRQIRHAIGRGAGRFARRDNSKRRHIVEVNLSRCFPEMSRRQREELSRRHYESMGQSIVDTGLIWFASPERLGKQVVLEGWEHVERARSAGKNVIFHVAHTAGLEFGAYAVSREEAGVGFYKPFKNPLLDWFTLRGRQRFGNEVFARDDGMLPYVRALKNGKVQYAMTDGNQSLDTSIFAPFFGQDRATLPIAGRLAKLGNARVLPFATYYEKHQHRYVARIFPALENFPSGNAQEDATILNHALEEMIQIAPEEYMWTLRLFRIQPDGKSAYSY